ncbi:IPT/TIG domain-containing protein [Kitasatospora sp. NPDC047058]|uniref:IPT/TIG domain-containing protein n=1 Tax=Kitasatospora sp. NPDC047058 TaxID=3155620 RepID=UPI0033C116EC
MITRMVRGGLAAALATTTLAAGAAVSAAATTAATTATGPNVSVTQAGNYPIFPVDNTNFAVTWTSNGTADLTGPTRLTVDLPPGLTTSGASITSTPDYTFTETVSADGRRLEAVFTGTRAPGRSEFMKVYVASHGTRPSGAITVTVANAGDTDPSDNVSTYLLGSGLQPRVTAPAPAVTGLGTMTGPGAGGTAVTVSGSHLANGFVLVGGKPASGSCTDTACTVTTPGGSGSAPVTVVTPGGSAAAPAAFDYTGAPPAPPAAPVVTNVTTKSGPAAGGTQLYVQGTNLTYGTVTFGGVPATHVSCGPTFCSATAPAGTGTVDVTVTTAGGTSAPVTADRFTYTA